MTQPNNTREVHALLDLLNYYRDIWDRQSHLLHPLTSLTSPKAKFKWTDVEHKEFYDIKSTVAHDTLLAYLDFNKRFDIHKDVRNYQLGSVIIQYGKPIALYSRKPTKTQTRYTVTEKELLSIIKTLKEFCKLLLDQKLMIFTDHKI